MRCRSPLELIVWQWAALDDVATVTSGNPAPQGEEFFEGGTHPFVRVQDLGRLKFSSHLNETADYVNDNAPKSLRLFPRGRAYDYEELVNRDKASLDIFWLKDESLSDSDNLPARR